MLAAIMEKLVLENKYKIVVPLFGAAFLSKVLIPTESRIQGLFKAFEGFPILFKAYIKFSRTFQESPLNSSTFQTCANPVNQVKQCHMKPTKSMISTFSVLDN